MLFRRVGVAFIFQQSERADEFEARVGGLDNFIYEAAFGGDIWVGKFSVDDSLST